MAVILVLDCSGWWGGEVAQRQGSSSLPGLGTYLLVVKLVCVVGADVVASVSAGAGQAQEGGRQAARALPGKR